MLQSLLSFRIPSFNRLIFKWRMLTGLAIFAIFLAPVKAQDEVTRIGAEEFNLVANPGFEQLTSNKTKVISTMDPLQGNEDPMQRMSERFETDQNGCPTRHEYLDRFFVKEWQGTDSEILMVGNNGQNCPFGWHPGLQTTTAKVPGFCRVPSREQSSRNQRYAGVFVRNGERAEYIGGSLRSNLVPGIEYSIRMDIAKSNQYPSSASEDANYSPGKCINYSTRAAAQTLEWLFIEKPYNTGVIAANKLESPEHENILRYNFFNGASNSTLFRAGAPSNSDTSQGARTELDGLLGLNGSWVDSYLLEVPLIQTNKIARSPYDKGSVADYFFKFEQISRQSNPESRWNLGGRHYIGMSIENGRAEHRCLEWQTIYKDNFKVSTSNQMNNFVVGVFNQPHSKGKPSVQFNKKFNFSGGSPSCPYDFADVSCTGTDTNAPNGGSYCTDDGRVICDNGGTPTCVPNENYQGQDTSEGFGTPDCSSLNRDAYYFVDNVSVTCEPKINFEIQAGRKTYKGLKYDSSEERTVTCEEMKNITIKQTRADNIVNGENLRIRVYTHRNDLEGATDPRFRALANGYKCSPNDNAVAVLSNVDRKEQDLFSILKKRNMKPSRQSRLKLGQDDRLTIVYEGRCHRASGKIEGEDSLITSPYQGQHITLKLKEPEAALQFFDEAGRAQKYVRLECGSRGSFRGRIASGVGEDRFFSLSASHEGIRNTDIAVSSNGTKELSLAQIFDKSRPINLGNDESYELEAKLGATCEVSEVLYSETRGATARVTYDLPKPFASVDAPTRPRVLSCGEFRNSDRRVQFESYLPHQTSPDATVSYEFLMERPNGEKEFFRFSYSDWMKLSGGSIGASLKQIVDFIVRERKANFMLTGGSKVYISIVDDCSFPNIQPRRATVDFLIEGEGGGNLQLDPRSTAYQCYPGRRLENGWFDINSTPHFSYFLPKGTSHSDFVYSWVLIDLDRDSRKIGSSAGSSFNTQKANEVAFGVNIRAILIDKYGEDYVNTVANGHRYKIVFTASPRGDDNCGFSRDMELNLQRFSKIYFPNVFSPNGDGINDEFIVGVNQNSGLVIEQASIFDRWGSRVSSKVNVPIVNGKAVIWDNVGIKNRSVGTLTPETSVYVYRVQFNRRGQNCRFEMAGDVTLMR